MLRTRSRGWACVAAIVVAACGSWGADVPGGGSSTTATGGLETTASSSASDGLETTAGGPLCGDGVVDAGEDCEPGLAGPPCASTCAWEPGAPLWTRVLNGASGQGDHGFGVVACDDGVYMVGETYVDGDGINLWLTRHAPETGALVWSTSLDGGGEGAGQDAGRGVACDPAGGVFVTGFSAQPSSGFDILVARVDSSGALRWLQLHDGPASGADMGHAIAVDGDGAVLVAGLVYAGADTHDDVWVARWSPDGALLWELRHDHGVGGNDRANGLALTPDGGFALTGTVEVGAPGVLEGDDLWLARFDASGELLWFATHDGPAPGLAYDAGHGVLVEPGGAVVVAGYESPGADASDIWLAKYSPGGERLWARAHAEPSGLVNMSYAIAGDSVGAALVVAGFRQREGEGEDIWVRKYTSDGEVAWTRTHDGGPYELARGVAIDSRGRVYVAGFSHVELEGHGFDGWLGAFAL